MGTKMLLTYYGVVDFIDKLPWTAFFRTKNYFSSCTESTKSKTLDHHSHKKKRGSKFSSIGEENCLTRYRKLETTLKRKAIFP